MFRKYCGSRYMEERCSGVRKNGLIGLIAFLLVFLFINQPAKAVPLPDPALISAGFNSAGFRLPSTATQPVIEYRRNIAMLANAPSQLSVRVYADGRVHVHYPVYMQNKGDYEYQMTHAELVALLKSLATRGMMEFDQARAKGEKQAEEAKLRAKGQYFAVSDAVESVVDIRLPAYQKSLLSPVQSNFSKRILWKNIEQDAKRYKNSPLVQSVAKAIGQLDSLMSHPAMRKVK